MKLFERVNPQVLFLCGLVIMLSFVFQASLFIRVVQAIFFILLSIAADKRFKLLPNVIMVLGIVLMHLITARGRILFHIGSWAITSGSLSLGLYRGFLLVGLIYISRTFVSSEIRLPGTLGKLLGGTFAYFELISENKADFNLKKPFISLDAMLLKLSETVIGEKTLEASQVVKPGFAVYIFPVLLVLANLFLWLVLPRIPAGSYIPF